MKLTSRLLISLCCSISSGFCVSAQTFTYTAFQTGGNEIALGYPVPLPIDSITPIAGFRTYESLHLRHQQLADTSDLFRQVNLGSTLEGRTIWGYMIGDAGDQMTESGTEASALFNGGIHAREWQSPEAATGYMETMFERQADQHIGQYLIENITLMVIPVLNIDGFLQTQRHPQTVTSNAQLPRDGRMRRKNMRDTDDRLDTVADNLNGVDLNRNNAPFWATNSQRSSDDVTSLVHHGSTPASEPETQALQQAALEVGEQQLRLYIDNHSFSQIYFTPMTGNTRRDTITTRIATAMRAANEFKYQYGPSPVGGGIGATDEYFANTYQIPSYTLEIEPDNGGQEYGGFGVSHDGFILPESEVPRMRQETSRAALAGLYAVADVPAMTGMQVWDASGSELLFEILWQASGQQGAEQRRTQVTTQASALTANTEYQLKLMFNKPMRQLNAGQVVGFSNVSDALGIEINWQAEQGGEDFFWETESDVGEWLTVDGFKQYQTDTFQVAFQFPETLDWQQLSRFSLVVDTTDFTGQGLDADPSTRVHWQNGSWQNYEDEFGDNETDSGGTDKSMRLVDDGSPLFAEPISPPPPAPLPPSPQPDNLSSGSVGLTDIPTLMALVLIGWLRGAAKGRSRRATSVMK